MNKLKAADFAKFLLERADAKDGYIMGSRGQDPKKWSKTSWWFTQYSGSKKKKALYWREHAQRVWDCQGLVEGYINQMTGSNIDVRARNNYATWCEPKGKGLPPAEYRLPGTAVFSGWPITHVGYLVEPMDPGKPSGDWWVVEARGVMYGVVKTRLSQRSWSRWGLMTKYFDYGQNAEKPAPELGERMLRNGMVGDDVREMQQMLLDLGFDLGRYGADGDFGPDTERAVCQFQECFRLTVDGIAGPDTLRVLMDAFATQEPEEKNEALRGTEEQQPDPKEPPKRYLVDFLDLSSYNSTKFPQIDWANIANTVGFLVLRCGCTRIKTKPLGIGPDTYFEKFAAKCNENHIPFWAYHYSHAQSQEEARAEARYLADKAVPFNPVGLCLDAEEGCLTCEIITAFFNELRYVWHGRTMIYEANHRRSQYKLPRNEDGFVSLCDATWIPFYGKNDGKLHTDKLPSCACDAVQGTSTYAHPAIPDKTLDANFITGQRRTLKWFRGEE